MSTTSKNSLRNLFWNYKASLQGVCVQVYVHVCTLLEDGIQSRVSFNPPCFLRQGISLAWSLPNSLGWLASDSRTTACFCLQCWEYQSVPSCLTLFFRCDFWGSSWGPPAYLAISLVSLHLASLKSSISVFSWSNGVGKIIKKAISYLLIVSHHIYLTKHLKEASIHRPKWTTHWVNMRVI